MRVASPLSGWGRRPGVRRHPPRHSKRSRRGRRDVGGPEPDPNREHQARLVRTYEGLQGTPQADPPIRRWARIICANASGRPRWSLRFPKTG